METERAKAILRGDVEPADDKVRDVVNDFAGYAAQLEEIENNMAKTRDVFNTLSRRRDTLRALLAKCVGDVLRWQPTGEPS